jgi:hypothetical protein
VRLDVDLTGPASHAAARWPQRPGAGLRVGQLDAAAELDDELDEELEPAVAGAAVVVGVDDDSPEDVAGVELEDDVPADTVDFDFDRESLR